MRGRGHAWLGAYVAGGHVWLGGHAWLEVCVAGGMHACGDMRGWTHTHPTPLVRSANGHPFIRSN